MPIYFAVLPSSFPLDSIKRGNMPDPPCLSQRTRRVHLLAASLAFCLNSTVATINVGKSKESHYTSAWCLRTIPVAMLPMKASTKSSRPYSTNYRRKPESSWGLTLMPNWDDASVTNSGQCSVHTDLIAELHVVSICFLPTSPTVSVSKTHFLPRQAITRSPTLMMANKQ